MNDKNFIEELRQKKYLKVGVLDNGELMVNEEGSAQGNIISPILANIYMHNVLTLWYKFIITKKCKGDNFLIVYADDFVAGFQYKGEAENYYKLLKERMEKFGLQLEDKAVQQDEEKVLNKIQKVGNAERIREKKKKSSTLKKAENRQNEIDRLFAKMYEDRACEKITERNFVMLSSKYQKEQIELEQQITSLREELSKMEQDMIGAEKWIELIKEYSVPKELTAPLLNAMIEKILIHEATTNEDNERIQEIEIYYRFIGKVE